MAVTSSKGAAINMTPFIDVVLVLLVIVLVTAQVASHAQRGMAATLPKAANGQALSAPHIVSALADGRLFIDKKPIVLRELEGALRSDDAAHARIALDIEPSVPHQRVIELLDVLATVGVTDAAFVAEAKR